MKAFLSIGANRPERFRSLRDRRRRSAAPSRGPRRRKSVMAIGIGWKLPRSIGDREFGPGRERPRRGGCSRHGASRRGAAGAIASKPSAGRSWRGAIGRTVSIRSGGGEKGGRVSCETFLCGVEHHVQSFQSPKNGAYWAGIRNGAQRWTARSALSAMARKAGSPEDRCSQRRRSRKGTILIQPDMRDPRLQVVALAIARRRRPARVDLLLEERAAARRAGWGSASARVAFGAPREAVRLISLPVEARIATASPSR